MRRDIDRDQRVARAAGRARPALTFQTDLLTTRDPRRNLDLNVLACRQMDSGLGTLCGVRECDRQRCVQVLSGARRCAHIVRFELLAGTAPATAPATEHPTQKVLKATATTAAA